MDSPSPEKTCVRIAWCEVRKNVRAVAVTEERANLRILAKNEEITQRNEDSCAAPLLYATFDMFRATFESNARNVSTKTRVASFSRGGASVAVGRRENGKTSTSFIPLLLAMSLFLPLTISPKESVTQCDETKPRSDPTTMTKPATDCTLLTTTTQRQQKRTIAILFGLLGFPWIW